MLVTVARLALVTTALTLVTSSFTTKADAQSVHPRCARVKDKVNCSCIFANGGQVRVVPGGRIRPGFATIGEYDSYARCMRRHGRMRG
jgi:hypothetical protein